MSNILINCESIHSSLKNVALISDIDNDGSNACNNNHDYENLLIMIAV